MAVLYTCTALTEIAKKEEGVDLAVIQDILAHTSVATTKRYRHTTPE